MKIEAVADIPQSALHYCLSRDKIHKKKKCFPDTLTTSLVPLKPFPLPPASDATIEVSEFESCSEKEVHPYTTYVNHLYVYPQSLSFDSQKIFTRARNIACVVELKDDDCENASSLYVSYLKIQENASLWNILGKLFSRE